jgi:DNA-binding transcriptional regulator GbsR (MarR family)
MIDRHSFIERMGLTAESDGLSRIAGRLFGALLLEKRVIAAITTHSPRISSPRSFVFASIGGRDFTV